MLVELHPRHGTHQIETMTTIGLKKEKNVDTHKNFF